ncbi:hypothetical protein [Natronorubrum thiooxidans]|uniref:Uncharacterized protein n=1 Tax=Natronorubrum thiooxidans TaxID=308853 RepID=A0A1N7GZV9_9EURY|nr:hypothetical protein [Natronorubrum thiooxidans]SIS18113.1 hypothetical protein SAMN05421752_11919 [Natronorubrum thiooxidans]
MTTCPYCGEPVSDDAYDAHLERAHAEELTPLDRRRVGATADESSHRERAVYVGAGLLLAVFVVGYAAIFFSGGSIDTSAVVEPDPSAPIHEHGTITVQYDDTVVAFDDPEHIERDDCFHFHGHDDAAIWHAHCSDVTLEYALETLGMDLTAEQFTVDGQTFDEADGDTVSVTVDGEDVDPQTYVLEGVESVDDAANGDGDHVEVVATSGE